MTIRSTRNEGIFGSSREVRGEGKELVLAGASEALAVLAEARDIDARATFQTTTPANDFNGTRVRAFVP